MTAAEKETPRADGEQKQEEPQQQEEEQVQPEDVSAGGRVRRATQKFTIVEEKKEEVDEFTPPVGAGTKLRDIAVAAEKVAELGKKNVEVLKALYLVFYGRRFQIKNLKPIKEQILEFSGIPASDDDEKAREVLVGKIGRWQRSFLQEVMDVLAVDRSKKSFDEQEAKFDKEALINRLIDWLYNPHEMKSGGRKASPKAAAAKKSPKASEKAKKTAAKRKSPTSAAAVKKKQKTTTTKATKKKTKAAADEEDTESEADEPAEASADDHDSSSDFEGKAKKGKKKTTPSKRARKAVVEDKEDEGEVMEKAPKQKAEDQPELDADIRDKVTEIIAQGNAEELTVKKIVRQLSEDLGRDLSSQKKAIKEFITAEQDADGDDEE